MPRTNVPQPEATSVDPAMNNANSLVEEARQGLIERINSLTKAPLKELKSLANPPRMVGDVCIWFANFFRFGGHADHTWMTVKQAMANPQKFLQTVIDFDYDNAPDPSVKKIKSLTLPSTPEVSQKS